MNREASPEQAAVGVDKGPGQGGEDRKYGVEEPELDEDLFRRLVLANQHDILARLVPREAAHHERNARMLREGWPFELVPEIATAEEYCADPLTREEVLFVIDILELYQVLQDAEDKGLKAEGPPGFAFPGFCGNYEIKLLSFYQDTRERERRLFESLRLANPRDLNSHWPMADFYSRMLAVWDELGRPRDLDEAQFQAIAAAWVPPERRGVETVLQSR
jgi:uncharacterized protein YfbU (UPF0304 family)